MISTLKCSSIAVIGGGNIGTQFACKCASKGYKVNMFSSNPELFDGSLEIVDEFENVVTGKLNKITSDMGEAIKDCQMIFVSHPAFMLREVANRMFPYIKDNMVICVLPGTGGAEFAFKECISGGYSMRIAKSTIRCET